MQFIKEMAITVFTIFNAMSPYLLLGFLFAGILHVFVPQQLFSKYLSKNNWVSVFYATLFAVPLPLCSCGVIPTAMAMYKEGASKSAVIAFLIATPQTGIDSIIATYSLLGLPFAVIRPLAAFFTAIFSGLVTAFFTSDGTVPTAGVGTEKLPTGTLPFTQKLKNVFQYGYVEMMEDIGKMLLFGLLVAGLIAYFVPDNFFTVFGNHTLLSMILVLLVAIPMYVCATGSIPIAIALMLKGMSAGTALVLLMAGPAANIASMLVIGKVLGKKTFLLYLITLIIGAIGAGLLIDNFLPAGWFAISRFGTVAHHGGHFSSFEVFCSVVLFVLFINALRVKRNKEKAAHLQNEGKQKMVAFRIGGMNCNHCQNNVTRVISNLPSVKAVTVSLGESVAYVEGAVTDEEIKAAVEAIGFEFKGRIKP